MHFFKDKMATQDGTVRETNFKVSEQVAHKPGGLIRMTPLIFELCHWLYFLHLSFLEANEHNPQPCFGSTLQDHVVLPLFQKYGRGN